MTNATGIAIHTAPIDRNDYRSLKGAVLAVFASIVLAACGGGAETTDNPVTQVTNPGDTQYNGPDPRDEEVRKFQQEFWSNAKTTDRCGSCHNDTFGQSPMFVRNDDVNLAYDAALPHVDTDQPSLSRFVERMNEDHYCWAQPGACATIMTNWIEAWLGDTAGGGRDIVLIPPVSNDPGDSKNFPADSVAFEALIHGPILSQYCAGCHSSEGDPAVQPYHSDADVDSAYDAAKPKINLDTPANSRLVLRLRNEFHFCWTDCTANAQTMEDAIQAFSDGITPTQVDPTLVYSKALKLVDGTLASGGNRYEDDQIALWEFKEGPGSSTAFDTSGKQPGVNLNLSQEVQWYGGWGITLNGGRAQATTTASQRVHTSITDASSGEFSIEAWVIPANVTQEMAQIVSFSQNEASRNFALQQTMYDYDFLLRTSETALNGEPAHSTPAMDEVLQATLQHVVATYDPLNGRRIYVNGLEVSNTDPIAGGNLNDWQDTFAVVLGGEVGSGGNWAGTIRLAALHDKALTQEQIQQNFDVGVGEKFFMLFDISEILYPGDATMVQSSYILFEVQQYDSYAYLFDKPHFITLDGSTPSGIPIEGMRVAMNGLEAPVGQSYATLVDELDAAEFVELGQPLSVLGAVLPLEKGPENDEFFLTFDLLDTSAFNRQPDPTLVITESDVPLDERVPRIGVKTFDEIDATYSAVTGVKRENFPAVDMTFQELRQSLPAVEDISTFVSSHQVAIAQLAIEYCSALVDVNGDTGSGTIFPGFNFDANRLTAFGVGNRDAFVNPLIDGIMGTGLGSQPNRADVYAELASFQAAGMRPDNLIDRLLNPIDPETGLPPVDPQTGLPLPPSNTRGVAKGVCAAMLGNAVTLIQ